MSSDRESLVEASHDRRYRAIWISDLHLGSKHAQVDALLEFLRVTDSDFLYLVGDIVDGWELRRSWRWPASYNTLIQKLLRKQRKGTEVVYVTGNHDEFLEPFLGLELGGLQLVREAIHLGADGRRYLVVHGHQFDGLTHFNRLLERLGARAYDVVLELNLWANRFRRRLGLGYWSFAGDLKLRAKKAVQYVTAFEEAMVSMAASRDVDGVICGHIHHAEIRDLNGIGYYNCGDWVENCTALTEDHEGNLSLVRSHESVPNGSRRGTRAPDPSDRRVPDFVAAG